jgi:hypothetical protein
MRGRTIVMKELQLSFKGARTYLQGGDFFNALTDIAPELTGHRDAFVDRLVFRRFAHTACVLDTAPPADQAREVCRTRFRMPGDQATVDGWVVETGTAITERRPFDEELLLADASLDQERRMARLPARSIYTPVEDVIALTKKLNYAISPLSAGKWVFGQLDLAEPLVDGYRELEIRMKNLIENRFSVNDIYVDGRRIGAIRFIVGAP